MSPAKVTLSPKERELVTDPGWILTKNRVIGKVYTLFGQLSEQYKEEWSKSSFAERSEPGFQSPKIAKGEQYRELPWVILDQPRHFTASDQFAIRSFFWWGNFCSITLQLSGTSKVNYQQALQYYFENNPSAMQDWWIGVGDDPWEHHFEESNYQPLSHMQVANMATLPHIKLAKKIGLQEWDNLNDFFTDNYREIVRMLNAGR